MSGGLIALLVALTEGESWGWTSGRTLGLGAAALVFLVAWGIRGAARHEPMVDMRMLARREILFTNITALIAGFAMFGTFVLVPNFVETPHGLSGGGAARGRLRLRRERDEGRPLSPAKLVRTALRRADRRADRAADRLQVAARRRDASRLDLRRGARRVARQAVADPRRDADPRRRRRIRLRGDGDAHHRGRAPDARPESPRG